MSYFIIARSASQADVIFETVTEWMHFVKKKDANAVSGPFLGVWFDASWDGSIPKELPVVGGMTTTIPIVSSFSISGLWAVCQLGSATVERDDLFEALSTIRGSQLSGALPSTYRKSEPPDTDNPNSPIFAKPGDEAIRNWTPSIL